MESGQRTASAVPSALCFKARVSRSQGWLPTPCEVKDGIGLILLPLLLSAKIIRPISMFSLSSLEGGTQGLTYAWQEIYQPNHIP